MLYVDSAKALKMDFRAGITVLLHAGRSQHAFEPGIQAVDAPLDHPLHAAGQGVPDDSRAFDPTTALILTDVLVILHVPQDFDREQRVSSGIPGQLMPKVVAQPVWFAVEQRIDKTTALSLVVTQNHPDVAEEPFELGQNAGQWVLLPFPAE